MWDLLFKGCTPNWECKLLLLQEHIEAAGKNKWSKIKESALVLLNKCQKRSWRVYNANTVCPGCASLLREKLFRKNLHTP
jgi:hypothetical protein